MKVIEVKQKTLKLYKVMPFNTRHKGTFIGLVTLFTRDHLLLCEQVSSEISFDVFL